MELLITLALKYRLFVFTFTIFASLLLAHGMFKTSANVADATTQSERRHGRGRLSAVHEIQLLRRTRTSPEALATKAETFLALLRARVLSTVNSHALSEAVIGGPKSLREEVPFRLARGIFWCQRTARDGIHARSQNSL